MGKSKHRPKISKHQVFSSAGTAKYIGKAIEGEAELKLIQYNPNGLLITENPDIEQIARQREPGFNHWIDLEGIHYIKLVERTAAAFDLHPLLIEDVLNTTQKAKLEYYEKSDLLFACLKVPRRNAQTQAIDTEQVSLVLMRDMAISFQELDNTDVFSPILERMNRENSKTKKARIDYLFYSFFDTITDYYYPILTEIEEALDLLEEEILHEARPGHQEKLFYLKREIIYLKKSLFPLKEIIGQLIRDDHHFFSDESKNYLRDVLDHVTENLDSVDTFRDDIDSLTTNYHSQLSNKMNSVMKTLTVFTAIFMPLTFIVGIYGMNFDHMPELRHPNGYFYTLGGMATLAVVLWIYFKWKKYI